MPTKHDLEIRITDQDTHIRHLNEIIKQQEEAAKQKRHKWNERIMTLHHGMNIITSLQTTYDEDIRASLDKYQMLVNFVNAALLYFEDELMAQADTDERMGGIWSQLLAARDLIDSEQWHAELRRLVTGNTQTQ